MHEERTEVGVQENPQREHEDRDIDARSILWFVAAMVVAGVMIFGILWWMRQSLESRVRASRPDAPVSAKGRLRLPEDAAKIPAPQLETLPSQVRDRLTAEEQRLATTHGWVDRDKGIVRVPLDRAMELVLKEGSLKSSKQGNAATRTDQTKGKQQR
jgi:hypothetical protein